MREYFKGKEPRTLSREEKMVRPDEAIVTGLAMQAAILQGDGDDFICCIHDVLPLSIGLETSGE